MTKIFVGSFSDKPELKTLTHTPENYDHSELASLNDVIRLTSGHYLHWLAVESGGRIELKEGVFFPFWGTKILLRKEYRALFLKEEATGDNFVIWCEQGTGRGENMASNSKPSKLFVGWDQGSPKERALTHAPEEWDCSKLASLAEVAELADAGLDEFSLAEDDAGSFVENVRTGDCFELQEGVFVASWEPPAPGTEDYFLFFVEASTGKRHEIW